MTVDVAAQYERYGPMVLRRCRALLRDGDRFVTGRAELGIHSIDTKRLSFSAGLGFGL